MPFQLSTLVAAALLGLTIFSSVSQAESVKADPMAKRGCIAKISKEESLTVMRRFHMHSFNGRDAEIRTLGTALIYIERLNGGRPPMRATADPKDNYGYNFRDATRNSHQAGNEIRVNRNGKKKYGENVAQLVHELGHYIGNSVVNGTTGYQKYYSAMGGEHYCKVSTYSDDNFHEQFAEVFAAFVTRPSLIVRNKTSNCRKAFKFFANTIFGPAAAPAALKCMAHQDALLAAANGENVAKKPATSTPVSAKPAAPKPKPSLKAIVASAMEPDDKK